jgi:hypothetical protein
MYYISIFFSNKTNHNKIYIFIKRLNKKNDQTYIKKSMTIIVKIQRE